MLIGWSFLNYWTNGEEVLSQSLPDICELVSLQFLQGWDHILDELLWVHNLSEVLKSTNGSCSHFRLSVLQKLTIVGGQVLFGILQSNSI